MKKTLILFIILNLIIIKSVLSADAVKLKELIKPPSNWFNLDKVKDGVCGIGTEKAYKTLLKNKKSQTITVAILDNGVDINHKDLKNKIWTNKNEIPGNGKDDDRNGYIDDIHGWNFNGNKDGRNVDDDNWEITRQYVKLSKKFGKVKQKGIRPKETKAYLEYLKVKKLYEDELKNVKDLIGQFKAGLKKLTDAEQIILNYLKINSFTDDQLNAIKSDNEKILDAKKIISRYHSHKWPKSRFEKMIKSKSDLLNMKLNPECDARHIVGDNYENKTEKYYGNNDVIGPNPWHGTIDAGLIAADRNNNIGIKGVADNVKLMVLRVAPSRGDERDKDVANAIYYAVNNGAKILCVVMAKHISPDKWVVNKAIKYAEKKGVLIVSGSGNNGKNVDDEMLYPNKKYLDNTYNNAWILVGASHWKYGNNLAAGFSNYSKINVDLFSPGIDITSISPGNKLDTVEGTSQATPIVAGAAALIWSYYPEFSAIELKNVILKSVTKFPGLKVKKPSKSSELVDFSTLSKTGGIINVYNALRLAEEKRSQRLINL